MAGAGVIAVTNEAGTTLAPGSAGYDAYLAALTASHRIRVTVTIRDRNEQPAKTIELPQMLTGAVQVDASQAVTRSLAMTYLDPANKLTFDSANPAAGATYADNFISVVYSVETELGWVDVPVFWGPVTGYSRAGAEVTVEAQGKESLALDPYLVVNGYNLHRNMLVGDAVAAVMGKIGEQRVKLGMVTGRLHNHRAVIRGHQPWQVCVGGDSDANGKPLPGLMSKAGGHPLLYYDGTGTLRAKRRGGSPVYTFDETSLLTRPGYTYDVLAARNRVYVEGGTPKGKPKKHYTGTAVLASGHPLSPKSLARNGHWRYLTTMAQNGSLTSDAACRAAAKIMLGQLSGQGIEASFDALPAPHLEEYDAVQMQTEGYEFAFPLRAFAIPLTTDQPMTVGAGIPTMVKRKSSTAHHGGHHHAPALAAHSARVKHKAAAHRAAH